MKETKYFMIRPINSSPEMVNNFLCNSIVAVGWSDIDLSKKFCLEDLFLDLKVNPLNEMPPQAAGRHRDQIVRFLSIVEEDKIIVPVNDCICLATATKQRKYNKEQIKNNQANEIVVKYLRNKNEDILYIPRSVLSKDFQRRLRVRGMTVISLNEFNEEIEKYFEIGSTEKNTFSLANEIEKIQSDNISEFKRKLLENIRLKKADMRTGGIELEKLVLEMIKLEGYMSYIPSKRVLTTFADADIIAVKADKFSESKLLFQIKHHNGVASPCEINQLLEIKKALPDYYVNYQLVFITSADISNDVQKYSEENNIIVIDGKGLVDWVYESLGDLSNSTKLQLGIIELAQILK